MKPNISVLLLAITTLILFLPSAGNAGFWQQANRYAECAAVLDLLETEDGWRKEQATNIKKVSEEFMFRASIFEVKSLAEGFYRSHFDERQTRRASFQASVDLRELLLDCIKLSEGMGLPLDVDPN